MAGMSVSWRHAARALAGVAAAVLALALLPSLLRTPEPPPLDPDIGLTGLAEAGPPIITPAGRPHRETGPAAQPSGEREPGAEPGRKRQGRSGRPGRDGERGRDADNPQRKADPSHQDSPAGGNGAACTSRPAGTVTAGTIAATCSSPRPGATTAPARAGAAGSAARRPSVRPLTPVGP